MTYPNEERREMKRIVEHYDMLGYIAYAQYGIPTKCPCGGRIVDEVSKNEGFDTLPRKKFFSCKEYKPDGLHFRQSCVFGVEEEIGRLKNRVKKAEELNKGVPELTREIQKLKEQVHILIGHVADLEKICFD